MSDEPVEVTGGAQMMTAQTSLTVPPDDGGEKILVITTAVGSFGPLGLVQPGWKGEISLTLFSERWMKPGNALAAKAIKAARAKGTA